MSMFGCPGPNEQVSPAPGTLVPRAPNFWVNASRWDVAITLPAPGQYSVCYWYRAAWRELAAFPAGPVAPSPSPSPAAPDPEPTGLAGAMAFLGKNLGFSIPIFGGLPLLCLLACLLLWMHRRRRKRQAGLEDVVWVNADPPVVPEVPRPPQCPCPTSHSLMPSAAPNPRQSS